MKNSRLDVFAAILLAIALTWGGWLRWQKALDSFNNSTLGEENYFELGLDLSKMDGSYSLRQYPGEEAFRSFLYPSLIALTYKVWPPAHAGKIRFLQAALGTLMLWLIFLIGREMHSALAGGAGALFAALDEPLISMASSLDIQCFFSLLTLAAVWQAAKWLEHPSGRSAAFLGLSIGISLACRSTLLLFPLVLVLTAALKRQNKLKQHAFLIALFSLIPLTPWIARNAFQLREFVALERSASIHNAFQASLGLIEGKGLQTSFELAQKQEPVLLGKDLESHHKAMRRMTFENISSHPFRYVWTSWKRFMRLIHYSFQAANPLLWILALTGAIAYTRRHAAVIALILYLLTIHAPFSIRSSYILPVIPSACILAGSGLAFLLLRVLRVSTENNHRNTRMGFPQSLAWLPGVAAYAAGVVFLGGDLLASRGSTESCVHLNGRAIQFFRQNDFSEAFRIFSEALKAHPDCIQAWNGQGSLLYAQERYGQALASFSQAERLLLSKDEKNMETGELLAAVLISRAETYERLGRNKEALKDYEECLEAAPSEWIQRRFVTEKIERLRGIRRR